MPKARWRRIWPMLASCEEKCDNVSVPSPNADNATPNNNLLQPADDEAVRAEEPQLERTAGGKRLGLGQRPRHGHDAVAGPDPALLGDPAVVLRQDAPLREPGAAGVGGRAGVRAGGGLGSWGMEVWGWRGRGGGEGGRCVAKRSSGPIASWRHLRDFRILTQLQKPWMFEATEARERHGKIHLAVPCQRDRISSDSVPVCPTHHDVRFEHIYSGYFPKPRPAERQLIAAATPRQALQRVRHRIL